MTDECTLPCTTNGDDSILKLCWQNRPRRLIFYCYTGDDSYCSSLRLEGMGAEALRSFCKKSGSATDQLQLKGYRSSRRITSLSVSSKGDGGLSLSLFFTEGSMPTVEIRVELSELERLELTRFITRPPEPVQPVCEMTFGL